MKTYKFEQTVLYADNYIRIVNLPDDIVFTEYNRYSDKQRFFFSVVKDPTEEIIEIFKKEFKYYAEIGNLLIGYLTNVMPLDDIPLISLDELNELYSKDLRQMYISCEHINQKYENLLSQLRYFIIDDKEDKLKEKLESEEYKKLEKDLNDFKKENTTYIEYILRPIKFSYGGDKGPTALCDCAQFRSWLDYDKEVDTFTKTNTNIIDWDTKNYYTRLSDKSIIHTGEDSKKYKEKFENRIKEIIASAFE